MLNRKVQRVCHALCTFFLLLPTFLAGCRSNINKRNYSMPTLKLLPVKTRDIIIQLKFFSESYNFIVDTGANTTCISQYLFNKLACGKGLSETIYRSIEERKYQGVGGTEVSQRVSLKINFLGKTLQKITIGHFLDEWNKQKHCAFRHDGLLGNDILMQFEKIVIDFKKGEISFL